MKKYVYSLSGVAIVAVAAFLVLLTPKAADAGDQYQFVVRGIVTRIDHANKNVTVAGTYLGTATAKDQAKREIVGSPIVYQVKSNSTFYKWVNGKKTRTTFTKAVTEGDAGKEVVIRGAKKSGGNYNIDWLVMNDRTFDVTGRIKAIDTNANTVRIQVGRSTFKQSRYVDKEVSFHYDNATKFKSLGNDVDEDDIPVSNQLVRVKGEVLDNNWHVDNFWDNVK